MSGRFFLYRSSQPVAAVGLRRGGSVQRLIYRFNHQFEFNEAMLQAPRVQTMLGLKPPGAFACGYQGKAPVSPSPVEKEKEGGISV